MERVRVRVARPRHNVGLQRGAIALLALALVWCTGCGEDTGLISEIGLGESVKGSVVLRFTAIPDEHTTLQLQRLSAVAAALEERLQVPVEAIPSSHYGATVDMFRNGDIHFAWFGGLTGVQARWAVPGARAIAQGVEDRQFYSYFIANRALGLRPSDSFPKTSRGLRFTFGSERSTSGRLMPEHFIRNETGKAPAEFYSQVGFSGSHPKTLALVNAGTFDVGVMNYRVYDAAPPEQKANTVVLWKTPTYADYNVTVQPDLDDIFRGDFTERLQEVLVALPKDVCEIAFSRSGLIPASNDDFRGIEDAARSIGLVR